jgi:hypothetical protein
MGATITMSARDVCPAWHPGHSREWESASSVPMHDESHSNVHDTEAAKGVELVFEDDYRRYNTIFAICCQVFSTFIEMSFRHTSEVP